MTQGVGRALQRLHLISGLPRSGSTLLCALLRQNPRFTAAMTSPVAALCATMHQRMCGGEFGVFFDNARRATMLRGVFEAYYADTPDRVVFDTNRSWTSRAALLGELYPDCRIVCCVREVGWILDSIEKLLAQNPLELSRLFGFQPGASVYSRAETLMNSETGLIGLAWSQMREAWFGSQAGRLIVIRYDSLAREPQTVLARLYDELGEPPFAHDFANVVYDQADYDALIGMPGLHKVRSKVEYQPRSPTIPPDLFAKYAATGFWEKRDLNPNKVLVL